MPLIDSGFNNDLRTSSVLSNDDKINIKNWEADLILCSDPDLEVQLDAEERGIKTLLVLLQSLENKLSKSNVVCIYQSILAGSDSTFVFICFLCFFIISLSLKILRQ